MIYIAIVDDKRHLRNMLHEKLTVAGKIEVLFTAENGEDFLEKMKIARKFIAPNIVLMDIDMPIMDGIEAVRQGKIRYPQTNYLMLTVFEENEKIFNAIKAGANGYLLKDEPIEHIKESIVQLMNNEGAPMSPSIARRTLNLLMNIPFELANSPSQQHNIDDFKLSNREKDVLKFLVDGLEYKEIGQQLDISPNTIRNHIVNIYRKLHVTSKAQAIRVIIDKKNN